MEKHCSDHNDAQKEYVQATIHRELKDVQNGRKIKKQIVRLYTDVT